MRKGVKDCGTFLIFVAFVTLAKAEKVTDFGGVTRPETEDSYPLGGPGKVSLKIGREKARKKAKKRPLSPKAKIEVAWP